MTAIDLPIATLRLNMAKIAGKCPSCDKPNNFDFLKDAEVHEYFDIRKDMQKRKSTLFRYVECFRGKILCAPCIQTDQENRKSMINRTRIKRIVDDTYKGKHPWMPEIAAGCTFDDSDKDVFKMNLKAWQDAARWEMNQQAFWLHGPEGVGKTYMARAIMNRQLVDYGVTIAEISCVEFNNKGSWWSYEETRKKLSKVQILLLEDLDKAVWTEKGLAALFDILDKRSGTKRRTFVTANADTAWVHGYMKKACPNNPSLPSTILNRMIPIRQIEMTGQSIRKLENERMAE